MADAGETSVGGRSGRDIAGGRSGVASASDRSFGRDYSRASGAESSRDYTSRSGDNFTFGRLKNGNEFETINGRPTGDSHARAAYYAAVKSGYINLTSKAKTPTQNAKAVKIATSYDVATINANDEAVPGLGLTETSGYLGFRDKPVFDKSLGKYTAQTTWSPADAAIDAISTLVGSLTGGSSKLVGMAFSKGANIVGNSIADGTLTSSNFSPSGTGAAHHAGRGGHSTFQAPDAATTAFSGAVADTSNPSIFVNVPPLSAAKNVSSLSSSYPNLFTAPTQTTSPASSVITSGGGGGGFGAIVLLMGAAVALWSAMR